VCGRVKRQVAARAGSGNVLVLVGVERNTAAP
jgi:hypothetical protein